MYRISSGVCWYEGSAVTWRGHKPERTLNREDLPLPLGPITSTERPGGTSNVSSRTNAVPSGALSASLCSSHMHKSVSHTQLPDACYSF